MKKKTVIATIIIVLLITVIVLASIILIEKKPWEKAKENAQDLKNMETSQPTTKPTSENGQARKENFTIQGDNNEFIFDKTYYQSNDVVYTYLVAKITEKYGDNLQYESTYEIEIPQINLDTNYVRKINKEILDIYDTEVEKYIKDNKYINFNAECVSYNKYVNDDIISIVIDVDGEYAGACRYVIYNIDKNGNEVTTEQILKKANISESRFKEKLINVIKNKEIYYNEALDSDLSNEKLEMTINEINKKAIKNFDIILNDKGHIAASVTLHIAVGGEISYEIIDIETEIVAREQKQEERYEEFTVNGDAEDIKFEKTYNVNTNNGIVYTYLTAKISEINNGQTYTYTCNVPQININSNYAKEINKEILSYYDQEIEGNIKENKFINFLVESIDYESYINDNVISIFVWITTENGGSPRLYAYNIDIQGNKVSNQMLLNKTKNTDETFRNKLEDKITKLGITNYIVSNMYDQTEINNTIEKYKNNVIDDFNLYINKDGNLSVILVVEMSAGSGSATVSIDLETGKIISYPYNE